MKARPTQSRKGVKGGTSSLFDCPLQGQGTASLVGFGATPQLFRGRPASKRTQQRRRQRSVPASNFARPQTRPQAAFPQDSVKNYNCDAYMEICAAAEGFASANATRGQWKQTNVCGRPLDLFAVASHVTWFLSLQGRQKGKQWFFTESWGEEQLGGASADAQS